VVTVVPIVDDVCGDWCCRLSQPNCIGAVVPGTAPRVSSQGDIDCLHGCPGRHSAGLHMVILLSCFLCAPSDGTDRGTGLANATV